MTIKIQAYQSKGIKTDKIIDEFEFCCWQSLLEWLKGFELHKCEECRKRVDAIPKSPLEKRQITSSEKQSNGKGKLKKNYYEVNREKILKEMKENREANKDEISKAKKAWKNITLSEKRRIISKRYEK